MEYRIDVSGGQPTKEGYADMESAEPLQVSVSGCAATGRIREPISVRKVLTTAARVVGWAYTSGDQGVLRPITRIPPERPF